MGGNSLDRFLIRAIIALTSLMLGVLAGFSLAVFFPKPSAAAEQPTPECEPQPAGAETKVAEPPQTLPVGEPLPDVEEAGEPEPEPEPEPDAEEPEVEPEPVGDGQAISGNLIIEIREVVGDARSKGDIRSVAKRGGHQYEACILQHGPELQVARVHHQLYVDASGKVIGKLLLSGVNPELDACTSEAIAGWNFGAAGESSFFRLKLVWTS